MDRLDLYDDIPAPMRRYLSTYGWHFSEKLYKWAVSRMKDRNGQRVQPMTKDAVDAQLRASGVTIEHNTYYDAAYLMSMALSDYMGSSLKDMNSVSVFVKDTLDDKDGYEGIALTRFYADCIGKGTMVDWEAVM